MAEIRNATKEYVDKTGLKRVVYNTTSSAYPPRPSGVAAGMVEYIGPVEPTDWLDDDTWIDTA
jgi:hypothetical protein